MTKKLLKLSFSITVFLIVNELLLSLVGPIYRRDFLSYRQGGYLFGSGISGVYFSRFAQKNKMNIKFNKADERNDETFSYKKPIGHYRILLFGDSTSFGQHLDIESTWAFLLQHKLQTQFPSKKIELINCAVIASSLIERYSLWERRCKKYQDVDLVIVQSTISSESASFSLFFGETLGRDHHIWTFLYHYYSRYAPQKLHVLKDFLSFDEFGLPVLRTTEDQKNLYASYFRPLTRGYQYSNMVRYFEHTILWPYRLRFTDNNQQLDYSGRNGTKFMNRLKKLNIDYQVKAPQADLAITILNTWKTRIEKENTHFLALLVPNSMGLNIHPTRITGMQPLEFNVRSEKKVAELRELSHLYQHFLVELKKKNISYINFLDLFGQEKTIQSYIVGDVHLNAKGNLIVAQTVAETIKDLIEDNEI